MSSRTRTFCFTTLAIGSKYRHHALVLAKDIEYLADNTPFVILTDDPDAFPHSENLIAIKHRIQSVGVYHDKLDCVAESFRQGFDDCFFLDADCRLVKNASVSRQWKLGLTAKSCYDLQKNLNRRNAQSGIYKLTEKIAQRYDILIEQCKFINEWIFVVSRDGNEDVFIQSWREIRDLLERQRIFSGEGVAIGMASRIAGWPVHHYDTGYPEEASLHQIIDIYKDKMFYQPELIPPAFLEKFRDLDSQRKSIEQKDPISRKISKIKGIIDREVRYIKLRVRNPHAPT